MKIFDLVFSFALFLCVVIGCGKEEFSVEEWSNLSHFVTENAQLGSPSPFENRVVFMGNSITIGWIHQVPEFFEGKPYVNRGISGQTTLQMLIRFRQDVVDLDPKVVVILAGTNDIAANVERNSIEMIAATVFSMAEIADANCIKVVLSSVLPVTDYPWNPGLEAAQKIMNLNTLVEEYTINNGHVYVDYFSAMVDSENNLQADLGDDGVHPNKKGYAIMAPLVEEAIKKALES